ncbi:MAG: ABC transporter substrate-binding protein [Paracoccaceae bacterium]
MRLRMFAAALIALHAPGAAGAGIEVDILYLERKTARPPTLSNISPPPDDAGLQGARLGQEDNASTGEFLGHSYALEEIIVDEDAPFAPAAEAALATGARIIVVNAPADDLLALADMPAAKGALIFNAAATDDRLRLDECRANILHTAPSRAMLADALMQFLTLRKWTDLFLIAGEGEGDQAYAAALTRSAAKFGARIRETKTWAFDADMRRSAAKEAPLFTQGVEYDVLLVADEREDFARYLLYNTWLARPVAGSEGLSPRGWSPVVEQWGAAQLQKRFTALAGRTMNETDYAAWAAIRTVGEAVTRTGASEPDALRAFILGDDFSLAGFKGLKMSYRPWNGQLRQPIPLVHPRALAAVAPIEGFLHQRTELDTLGFDQLESPCRAFN